MVKQSKATVELMDESRAESLIEDTISKSWLETWGAASLSTGIYVLVVSMLLFHEEVTLAWGWRVLVIVFFALIPAVFIRNGLVQGSFVLGLSKKGLLYRVRDVKGRLAFCAWSKVTSVQHRYDGENDFVVIGLTGSSGEVQIRPMHGHIEDRDGIRWLFMDSVSRRRALQSIDVIERYWMK